MAEDLISVIVPVYNIENYIECCIKSIINQTYKNLEVILVDDGSTDKTGNICDEYKNIDKRIKVIHRKNEGVSSARNIGLENSCGKFIAFVDGDDYIEKNYLEFLYKSLIAHGADISICGTNDMRGNKIKSFSKVFQKSLTSEEALIELFKREKISVAIWGKLIKKKLFNEIKFNTEIKIAEDLDVMYKLFDNSKSVYVDTSKRLYYWQIRKESAVHKEYNDSFEDEVKVELNIIKFIKEKYTEILSYAIDQYIKTNFNCMKKAILAGQNNEVIKYEKNINLIIKDYNFKLNKKEKIKFFIFSNKYLRKLYKLYNYILKR